MKEHCKELFQKHRSVIAYVFFGVCTTLVNVATYCVFHELLRFSNIAATIIAWFLAVLFAFYTNKVYVFESKSFQYSVFMKELLLFYLCRLMTGGMDLAIMYTAVDTLQLNAPLSKAASDILVIIINYIASKFLIFSHQGKA